MEKKETKKKKKEKGEFLQSFIPMLAVALVQLLP